MDDIYLSNTILKGDTEANDKSYSELIPKPQENIYNFINSNIDIELPDNFDGKIIWKNYLTNITNQKNCGSCWAFSAVSVLSDRFNIHSKGLLQLELSPVSIVLCDTHGAYNPEPLKDLEESEFLFETSRKLYGCNGNLLSEAWRMLFTLGTNTTKCMPLSILNYQSPSSCIKLMGPAGDMCSDYIFNYLNNIEYGTPAKFYNAKFVYSIPGVEKDDGNEANIRRDIYKFGPVSTAMEIYPDFYTFNFKDKIYISNFEGKRQSGHAVIIDGWGEENNIKFWWVRNSWGEKWGMNGYFKIIRGVNHCKIEENVVTGIPNLQSASLVLDIKNIPKNIQDKFLINSPQNIAGGIDPDTGYSRRILSFLKYDNDVKFTVKNIPFPNYSDFLAANVGSSVEEKYKTITYKNNTPIKAKKSYIIYYIVMFLLLTLLLLFFNYYN